MQSPVPAKTHSKRLRLHLKDLDDSVIPSVSICVCVCLCVCVCVCVCVLCHVQLFVTPQTVAHQPPLSMAFSSQEYWSGLLSPYPGCLPNPRIGPKSPASPALPVGSLLLSQQGSSSAYDANHYPKFKGFQKQNETKQSKNSWHLCYSVFCTLYYSWSSHELSKVGTRRMITPI